MTTGVTRFIERPNLPKEKTYCVLLGKAYRQELESSLEKQGVCPLWCPDNPIVDSRLRGHIDLTALHLGGHKLLISAEIFEGNPEFVKILTNRGVKIIKCGHRQDTKYPGDSMLCAAIAGDNLICRPDSAAPDIFREIPNLKMLSVNQGYTKCSVCVVSETAIITSDEGIRRKALQTGLDVLTIAPGYIALDGFGTGFIGGASFKLSEREMAFTGCLDMHPDEGRILEFLAKHEIKAVYLTEKNAFDIGSAIPLTEYV